jgi:NADPH-dependent 2,4-dienoyl-CoA reductase/sulfur reductase-like enzyme
MELAACRVPQAAFLLLSRRSIRHAGIQLVGIKIGIAVPSGAHPVMMMVMMVMMHVVIGGLRAVKSGWCGGRRSRRRTRLIGGLGEGGDAREHRGGGGNIEGSRHDWTSKSDSFSRNPF